MPSLDSLFRASVAAASLAYVEPAFSQGGGGGGGGGGNPRMREATRLDAEGKHAESRAILQDLINTAATPRDKAAAQRTMGRSAGFTRDCDMSIRFEEMVIAYHVTREQAEPQDAFYQQGEMANEAARICADAGKLDEAERMYRRGSELGNKEPEPRTHPRSLWDFRLTHALSRIAAQRGSRVDANRHMADARRALDEMAKADTGLARAQERFYQYLPAYIALFTNDNQTAVKEWERALAIRGNEGDPQMQYFLGVAYERTGQADKARAQFQKAYDMATSHNPPASFARPAARQKLGIRTP